MGYQTATRRRTWTALAVSSGVLILAWSWPRETYLHESAEANTRPRLPAHIRQVKIQADGLYRQHQYQAALRSYEQTFALLAQESLTDLTWAEANVANNIGNMYKKLGQVTQARLWYHKSLERNPAHVQALVNFANLNLKLGDVRAASELFRQVLEIEPECPEALMGLASALRGGSGQGVHHHHRAEATALLLRANELRPESPDVLANLGLTFLGAEDRDLERAVSYLKQAAALGHEGAEVQLRKTLQALSKIQ